MTPSPAAAEEFAMPQAAEKNPDKPVRAKSDAKPAAEFDW